MKKQDLAIITSKIIESLYNGMRVSTVDPHEYSTYNEREIAQDYRDLVYTLQEVELRNDARARRAGYIEIDESIRKKYKPQSFDEEVYYLADEFARPYNIFLRKDNPPYTSAIPENAKADRVIKHYQAFIYILFLDVKRRLVMMEPAVNTKGFKREKKNMIAKGQPTPDTIERGEEQFLYIKLFRYAKEIRRRLDLVNELQGLEKQERKYNILNWMLTKINGESGEFVKLCEDFPPEEYTFIYDSCCFEKEELESLESFVDMIRKEQKREEEDDYYCSWLQEKTEGHFKSLLVLYILVHKLKYELKDTRSLLESANYHPGKSKKESVGNIINMYGGGSYTDVHGNANVTLNITTGIKNEPDSGDEMMSPEEQVPEVVQEEHEEQEEELNPDAPKISLQQLLKQPWFAEVRSDERYDEAWTDAFVEALIQSEYGKDIARDWNNNSKFNKCTEIKGYVIGTLKVAGVVKDISNDKVAKSVALMSNYRSFGKYIGKGKLQPYVGWVKEYVVDNNTLTK